MVCRRAGGALRSFDAGRRFELADGSLGLLLTSGAFEEAHGFGQASTHPHRVERGHEAEEHGPTPPVLARHHSEADDGGEQPAHGPERLESDDHAAPQSARRVLTHERRGDGQFGAEAQTDNEAQSAQHEERRCEG